MKKLTDIDRAYQHYLDLVGDNAGHPVRTKDELADQIHRRNLRYEEIDDRFWRAIFESGWGFTNAADDVECAYCHEIVPPRDVPAVNDHVAWRAMSFHHAPGCLWISTRAHRVDPSHTVVTGREPTACPRCGGMLVQGRTPDEMFCQLCGARLAYDARYGWIAP